MTNDVKLWQQDGRRAFEWLITMYEQSKTLYDDAKANLEEAGYRVFEGSGMGGTAYSATLDQWPFVSLRALAACPEGTEPDSPTGRAIVFGLLFHDGHREGPTCFVGHATWSKAEAEVDHWTLYYALGGDGKHRTAFERTTGWIRSATPTLQGKIFRPGIDAVKWFEVPLGAIESPDRLGAIVDAGVALFRGDEAPAARLASEYQRPV